MYTGLAGIHMHAAGLKVFYMKAKIIKAPQTCFEVVSYGDTLTGFIACRLYLGFSTHIQCLVSMQAS